MVLKISSSGFYYLLDHDLCTTKFQVAYEM